MKLVKALLAVAVSLTPVASYAATYYVNRYIYLPPGAPCMVSFAGRHVNASQIQDVAIGTWTRLEEKREADKTTFSSNYVEKQYKALRVTFGNTSYFQVFDGSLEQQRDALLAAIKACGAPVSPTTPTKLDDK